MSRRRFFVPQESIRDGIARLPSDQAHHLRNVLRVRTGDVVEVFDGKGAGYEGKVDVRDEEILVRELRSIPVPEARVPVTLAASMIKAAKFEWILQKATELGVREIVPLKTRRSEIEISGVKIAGRLQRWERIVVEASKQCRRSRAPGIREPQAFADFLSTGEFAPCARFLLYEKASECWRPNPRSLENGVVLCIGPEGGWDESEVEQAAAAGFEVFSLGPWILRAETAAIAAVSVVQHHLNLLSLEP